MKKLKASSQYKKDYKLFKNKHKKGMEHKESLNRLANEEPSLEKNNTHMLTGDYKGYMECHIESDFLLIWFDPDTDQIDLVRLGSHSELFG